MNHDTHCHAGHEEHGTHGGHECHGAHGGHEEHHEMMVRDFRTRFWVSLGLTIPMLILSPMIQEWLGIGEAVSFPGDRYLLLGLAIVIYVYGGKPFLAGLVRELRERQPGMMTLISLAITVAFAYSGVVMLGLKGKVFFWELATLIDVMLLGHWIEMRSVMGASRALRELVAFMPDQAHLLQDNGTAEDVAISELKPGDRVLIKPGEKVPADGEIMDGHSALDQSMLTGEATPVEKGSGEEVIGGSVNGDGSLQIEVQKAGEESYLAQVIAMVEQAQESKSRSQDLANRAAFWLTIIALTAGIITFVAWYLGADRPFDWSLERAITVMVITCPHALGLAIPLVVAVSTAVGARHGLLIRERTAFERARSLQAVVFDKTGTLTEGRFGVVELATSGDIAEEELLRLAASVEYHSEHPIARGIIRQADEYDLELPVAGNFQAITGKGAKATVAGREIFVVSPGYLYENGIALPPQIDASVSGSGRTLVYVLEGDQVLGAIALADIIREESREAINALKSAGIQPMMLTGDNEDVARWVADELGLADYFAQVLPDEKAARIRQIQQRGLIVGMVGDGINDAPALTQADVGIAIGAGTQVAIESADVVLVENDPRDVVELVGLSRATWGKMVQNLVWATGYNAFAIPLAAGVLAGYGIILVPAVGAIIMSLSTVIVAINARLLRIPE